MHLLPRCLHDRFRAYFPRSKKSLSEKELLSPPPQDENNATTVQCTEVFPLPGGGKRIVSTSAECLISCPCCKVDDSIAVYYFTTWDSEDRKVGSGLVFKQKEAKDVYLEVPYVTNWTAFYPRGLVYKDLRKNVIMGTGERRKGCGKGNGVEKKRGMGVKCGECGKTGVEVFDGPFSPNADSKVKKWRGKTFDSLCFKAI